MSLRDLIGAAGDATERELWRLLSRLRNAAERDPEVDYCEDCRNPIFHDDTMVSTCEVRGCWFAATKREEDRPDWCKPRAAILRAMEAEGRATGGKDG